MFDKVNGYKALVRQYGLRNCLFRLSHDLSRKYGLLKRKFPAWQWEQSTPSYWLHEGVPFEGMQYRLFRENCKVDFFFPLGEPPRPADKWADNAIRQAEAILKGSFRYFSHKEAHLSYPEPDWFRNPFTEQRESVEKHWCGRDDFEPSRGDIKFIWEPSRFSWAYALVRAYAVNRNDEYAEAFWRLLESWMRANPPQMGPNWQCGQEIALRLIACVFALYTFWKSPATTDKRISSLIVFIGASTRRIAGNINYARAQMGNHAVSEAMALWTVGVLFPEFIESLRWQKLGKSVLEDEVRRYNFPDGAYTQHSMNYQRVMLHDYLWCLRLGELNGETFLDLTLKRLKSSYEFLYQLQDSETGRTPNYGPNDGTIVLPLNDCDYLDYRPVIEAMHYFYKRARLYEQGPWCEDLLWLFGSTALESPLDRIAQTSRDFFDSGYFTLRGKQSWGMIRCHSYRSRPNQADMLHLDLWWRGINVLRDSGSFTYYDPKQNWNNFFTSTPAHNTITVGGVDQMIKGPRFRWYSLVKSHFIEHKKYGQIEVWQGEHYGYKRLASRAVCRRLICKITDARWLVVDDILGGGKEKTTIIWNLPADCDLSLKANTLKLFTPKGLVSIALYCSAQQNKAVVARGENNERRLGWQSSYYGEKTQAPTLYMDVCDSLPIRFISLISLGQSCSAESDGYSFIKCSLEEDNDIEAKLSEPMRRGKISVTLRYRDEIIST